MYFDLVQNGPGGPVFRVGPERLEALVPQVARDQKGCFSPFGPEIKPPRTNAIGSVADKIRLYKVGIC